MAKLRFLRIESLRFWSFVPEKTNVRLQKFYFDPSLSNCFAFAVIFEITHFVPTRYYTILEYFRSFFLRSWGFMDQTHSFFFDLELFWIKPIRFSWILRYFGSNPFVFLRSWGILDQTQSFFFDPEVFWIKPICFFQSWGILDQPHLFFFNLEVFLDQTHLFPFVP